MYTVVNELTLQRSRCEMADQRDEALLVASLREPGCAYDAVGLNALADLREAAGDAKGAADYRSAARAAEAIIRVRYDESVERTRHEQRMLNLASQARSVRLVCPHPAPLRVRHPDPAGGSDSWTECAACGADVS